MSHIKAFTLRDAFGQSLTKGQIGNRTLSVLMCKEITVFVSLRIVMGQRHFVFEVTVQSAFRAK